MAHFFTGCPLKTGRHPLDRHVKTAHVTGHAVEEEARVVHHDAQVLGAPPLDARADERLRKPVVHDAPRHAERLAAARLDLRNDRRGRFLGEVVHHEPCALVRKELRDRRADSAARTRDDRCAA